MKIREVLLLPDKTIVESVHGNLVSIGAYERKTRPDGEEYTAQSFQLRDDDCMLFGTAYDHYPLDERINQELYFCSMKSRNGRFGGVVTMKQFPTSIFNRAISPTVIRISKAGAIHTPDSYKNLNRK